MVVRTGTATWTSCECPDGGIGAGSHVHHRCRLAKSNGEAPNGRRCPGPRTAAGSTSQGAWSHDGHGGQPPGVYRLTWHGHGFSFPAGGPAARKGRISEPISASNAARISVSLTSAMAGPAPSAAVRRDRVADARIDLEDPIQADHTHHLGYGTLDRGKLHVAANSFHPGVDPNERPQPQA